MWCPCCKITILALHQYDTSGAGSNISGLAQQGTFAHVGNLRPRLTRHPYCEIKSSTVAKAVPSFSNHINDLALTFVQSPVPQMSSLYLWCLPLSLSLLLYPKFEKPRTPSVALSTLPVLIQRPPIAPIPLKLPPTNFPYNVNIGATPSRICYCCGLLGKGERSFFLCFLAFNL